MLCREMDLWMSLATCLQLSSHSRKARAADKIRRGVVRREDPCPCPKRCPWLFPIGSPSFARSVSHVNERRTSLLCIAPQSFVSISIRAGCVCLDMCRFLALFLLPGRCQCRRSCHNPRVSAVSIHGSALQSSEPNAAEPPDASFFFLFFICARHLFSFSAR